MNSATFTPTNTDKATYLVTAYAQVDKTGFAIRESKYDQREVTISLDGLIRFGRIGGPYASLTAAADRIQAMGLFPGAATLGVAFKEYAQVAA